MKQERKYRVQTFTGILGYLNEKHANKEPEITATHYYGKHEGNDVKKFVVFTDRTELHTLKETNGKFILTEHRQIDGKKAGFTWLKDHGYKTVDVVKMTYTNYPYKDGVIGLYTIDDFLFSIILEFPPGQHDGIEREFGLQNTERIEVPFNKYLKKIGRLSSITLS